MAEEIFWFKWRIMHNSDIYTTGRPIDESCVAFTGAMVFNKSIMTFYSGLSI